MDCLASSKSLNKAMSTGAKKTARKTTSAASTLCAEVDESDTAPEDDGSLSEKMLLKAIEQISNWFSSVAYF